MSRQSGKGPAVRRLFVEIGGNVGMKTLARTAVEHGVYTTEEVEAFAIRGIANDCRRHMVEPDETGLRFAGMAADQSENTGGGPVWRARSIWDLADYRCNVGELMRNRDALDTEINLLRAECRVRLGQDPLYGSALVDGDGTWPSTNDATPSAP